MLPRGARPVRVLQVTDLHFVPGQDRKLRWVRDLARLEPEHLGDVDRLLPGANPGAGGAVRDQRGALVESRADVGLCGRAGREHAHGDACVPRVRHSRDADRADQLRLPRDADGVTWQRQRGDDGGGQLGHRQQAHPGEVVVLLAVAVPDRRAADNPDASGRSVELGVEADGLDVLGEAVTVLGLGDDAARAARDGVERNLPHAAVGADRLGDSTVERGRQRGRDARADGDRRGDVRVGDRPVVAHDDEVDALLPGGRLGRRGAAGQGHRREVQRDRRGQREGEACHAAHALPGRARRDGHRRRGAGRAVGEGVPDVVPEDAVPAGDERPLGTEGVGAARVRRHARYLSALVILRKMRRRSGAREKSSSKAAVGSSVSVPSSCRRRTVSTGIWNVAPSSTATVTSPTW